MTILQFFIDGAFEFLLNNIFLKKQHAIHGLAWIKQCRDKNKQKVSHFLFFEPFLTEIYQTFSKKLKSTWFFYEIYYITKLVLSLKLNPKSLEFSFSLEPQKNLMSSNICYCELR